MLDAARLKQVLYNYVSNALKFTPRAGRIAVRARPEPDNVSFRIEVEDSGIGIAPDDMGRLFVEFQQLEAGASSKRKGTGLGLALTKRLVESQGGTVGVSSTLGAGSTFYAVLPRRSAATAGVVQQSAASDVDGAPLILVVEDHAHERSALVETLVDAGYAVDAASTGAQALIKCSERAFAAITLDLLLPDTSGLEVLRAIRSSALNSEVPVIVVTVIAEKGAVAGFAVEDILAKPLDSRALLAALNRAGVAPARSGDVLVIDDDAASLRLMSATLQQLGYRAHCVSNGDAGLRAAQDSPPRAAVLDLMMPAMDGFEFLERFRRIPHCDQVPVIVWTVKDLTAQEYARLQVTAQCIIAKSPGGMVALVRELRTFIAAKRAQVH